MGTKTKKEISGKSVGRNVILNIDGKKFSKAFTKKEDREEILDMVEKYNKRNTKKLENEIIEKMQKTVKTDKEEVVKKAASKSKSTAKPKVTKKTKAEEIEAAKKLLEENEYTVAKKVGTTPRPTQQRRGREH